MNDIVWAFGEQDFVDRAKANEPAHLSRRSFVLDRRDGEVRVVIFHKNFPAVSNFNFLPNYFIAQTLPTTFHDIHDVRPRKVTLKDDRTPGISQASAGHSARISAPTIRPGLVRSMPSAWRTAD